MMTYILILFLLVFLSVQLYVSIQVEHQHHVIIMLHVLGFGLYIGLGLWFELGLGNPVGYVVTGATAAVVYVAWGRRDRHWGPPNGRGHCCPLQLLLRRLHTSLT